MLAHWATAPSLLSVPLTLGLLHPLDVVRAGEDAHRAGAMPIASAEGFVRQVLGWREYVRQLYWRFGRSYLRRNALRVSISAMASRLIPAHPPPLRRETTACHED